MAYSKQNQSLFLLSMASLLENGKTLQQALDVISEGEGKTAKIARDIQERFEDGDIYEAFEGFDFPVRLAIDSSFQKGMIDKGIRRCLESLDIVSVGKSKLIITALMPVVLLTFMIIMCVVTGTQLLPSFVRDIPQSEWPITTQILWDFSHFMAAHGVSILIFFSFFYLVYRWSLPNWASCEARSFMERIVPGYRFYRAFESQSFVEILALQMEVEASLSRSLVSIKDKAAPFLLSHIEYILEEIGDDTAPVINAFDSGLISKENISILTNVSVGGVDIMKGLKVVAEKGRREIKIRMEVAAIVIPLVTGIIALSFIILLMTSISPLALMVSDKISM